MNVIGANVLDNGIEGRVFMAVERPSGIDEARKWVRSMPKGMRAKTRKAWFEQNPPPKAISEWLQNPDNVRVITIPEFVEFLKSKPDTIAVIETNTDRSFGHKSFLGPVASQIRLVSLRMTNDYRELFQYNKLSNRFTTEKDKREFKDRLDAKILLLIALIAKDPLGRIKEHTTEKPATRLMESPLYETWDACFRRKKFSDWDFVKNLYGILGEPKQYKGQPVYILAKNNKRWNDTYVPLLGVAATLATSRKDFMEHLLGYHYHGAPSLMRARLQHFLLPSLQRGTKNRAPIKATELQKALRQFYHIVKSSEKDDLSDFKNWLRKQFPYAEINF